MGLQSTRFHISPYKADIWNLPEFRASNSHGTMLALRQYLYQKEAIGEKSQKYNSWVDAKRVQTSTGLQIIRFHISPYRAHNWNLPEFLDSYRHGTMLARKQYLYQKEARGEESPKIYSLSRCKKSTNLYEPANYPLYNSTVYRRHWKFAWIQGILSPRYHDCNKAIFISKGSYGGGEPKNIFLELVEKWYKPLWACKLPAFM